jgi:hypothetical protein
MKTDPYEDAEDEAIKGTVEDIEPAPPSPYDWTPPAEDSTSDES